MQVLLLAHSCWRLCVRVRGDPTSLTQLRSRPRQTANTSRGWDHLLVCLLFQLITKFVGALGAGLAKILQPSAAPARRGGNSCDVQHAHNSRRHAARSFSLKRCFPSLPANQASNPLISQRVNCGRKSLNTRTIIGPTVTTKREGRMKKKIGNTSLTPIFAAFSSAIWRAWTLM